MRVAIDPGISTGVALFKDSGELYACMAGDPRDLLPVVDHCASAIIEVPQVYPNDPVNPNNLITLAVRVGEYSQFLRARGTRVALTFPHAWKGSVRKIVMCNRILLGLPPHELALYKTATEGLTEKVKLDVIDAIGLGRWATSSRHWP